MIEITIRRPNEFPQTVQLFPTIHNPLIVALDYCREQNAKLVKLTVDGQTYNF